ncbi:Gamma-glutamyl phosphate reductase [Streptomyces sp. YIM 121038]|uniref:glutamate-5-semialdehyde dehydrogenase n=1 Tax=Streptomyces sp. YIM 121038 TaxID=2136401 RepID=UPI00111085A4|nr:glutamate-5-semialdehyde dehydrogenase [Streptomyces sp. YIM 121038]QCX81989.1 Gamma-glutamyl phosphate reductase [Streptomyces sp. YIM 121038]
MTGDVVDRRAAAAAARLTGDQKRAALHAVADAMAERFGEIAETNKDEFARAERTGSVTGKALRRMLVERPRFDRIINGVRWLAECPDPVGEISELRPQPNGLLVGRMRVPLGVIAAVYESRPEVTLEAAAMALKSGNAIVLRGGRESTRTNRLLVRIIQDCLKDVGVPPGTIRYVDDPSREALWDLLGGDHRIDLVVARGSDAFIAEVRRRSPWPVLASGGGNCHIYVDASADLDSATRIVLNAKLSAPTMCNAVETVLVHAAHAPGYVSSLVAELHRAEVAVHGCLQVCAAAPEATRADEKDWRAEFLGPTVAMRVVPDLETAVDHINTYGTGHSEAIVTADLANARQFQYAVDAAAVFVNASTRFTYGYEFGLGPMLGVSTQKLHARGPIGVTDLTSRKFVVTGAGQLRTAP